MPGPESRLPGRRQLLKSAAGATLGALASSAAPAAEPSTPSGGDPAPAVAARPFDPPRPDLVRAENARPGSLDWQLTRVKLDKQGGYRSPLIEGYCARQSVAPGDTLPVMVSTNPPAEFVLDVFRMGYYDGRGARHMTRVGPLAGHTQPDPPVGPNRLRECRWEPSCELRIGDDWPSGVYLGRLTRQPRGDTDPGWQSYVVFVVRDHRRADVLFQVSDNTWQAYNRWPDEYSLYDSGRPGYSLVPGVDVSFDRPYGKYRQIYENPQSVGSGEFLCWEYPLAYWLEQHGYDVTYVSNSDLIEPDAARRGKVFISVGHDEYWDLRQYAHVKAAIDAGTSALFLSGNSVCFVSPLRQSTDGRPARIISRDGRYGGLTEAEKAIMGPFPIDGPNEALLMGARTITPFNGGGDWTVTRPEHWLFAGTGMQRGEGIPGLVGWEFHGDPAAIPGLEVVAEGRALNAGNKVAHWTATVYPGPRGNIVFNAATIFWAQGLASPPGHMLPWSHWTRPHGPDARVQRITHNALRRAIDGATA